MGKIKVLTFLLLGGALLVRIVGMTYGLPYMLYPDENRQILDSLGMLSQKTLIPYENAYPALHKYLLMIVYGIYYSFGYFLGYFSSPQDFAISFLVSPGNIIFISRCLSVLFGFGIIICAYAIGKKFFPPYGKWFCTLLFGFFLHFILVSQWAMGDVVMLFFAIASLYYMLSNIEGPSQKSYFLSSLFLGLSLSAKYKTLFMCGPWVFSIVVSWPYLKKHKPFRTLVLLCFVPFCFSLLLGNLALIFKFQEVYQRFQMLVSEAHYGIASAPLFSKNPLDYFFWFIKATIWQEKMIGFLSIAGIFFVFFRITNPLYLFFAIYITFAILFWSRSPARYLHHILPLYFVTLTLASEILNTLCNKFTFKKYKNILCISLSLMIIAPSLKTYFSISRNKLKHDTRIIAKEWIENHIPFHSKIGMDWYELNVPLLSDIPPSFNNPLGITFYKNNFNPILKSKYLTAISAKSYDLYPLIATEENLRWPDSMPKHLRQEAQKIYYIKMLYSRYLTPASIDELKQKGIQYVILSSYSYSSFLLNNDPSKTPLLTNYFEDSQPNNQHSSSYTPSTSNSILYFLAEQNRNFYKLFLDGGNPSAKLLKEFIPLHNLGPTIKIYRIL